jgi:hypothetical protein
MNKQQNALKNNTIDFTDETATKKMGNAAVSLKHITANMLWCINYIFWKIALCQLLPHGEWRGRLNRAKFNSAVCTFWPFLVSKWLTGLLRVNCFPEQNPNCWYHLGSLSSASHCKMRESY